MQWIVPGVEADVFIYEMCILNRGVFLTYAAQAEESEPFMQNIMQQITMYFQQISARLPGIPTSLLLFLIGLAGFLALVVVLLVLRLFWSLIEAIFGIKRRRRARGADPTWERQMRLNALRQQHRWQREDYW